MMINLAMDWNRWRLGRRVCENGLKPKSIITKLLERESRHRRTFQNHH